MSGVYKASIEFRHNGRKHVAYVEADSWQDAEEKVKSLRVSGRLAGWPTFSAPSNALILPLSLLWLKFRTWWWITFQQERK